MTDTLATTALKILDDLQLKESRLLSWGMVDGAFTNDEIEGIAERVIESLGVDIDPDDALEWLEDRALLFNLPAPEEDRYRTRVAEGVRLFARLRQIFSNRSWSDAKELVADFRFVTLPRRYPDRYIDPGDAVMQLKRDLDCSALQTEVAFQLLGGENSGWKLADFQVEATARILAEAKTDHASATIVCAGTGSGKTLAFYLPAFMHIAERLEDDPRTQCLAIYPRNELLRDQLKTAILNARMVDTVVRKRRGRPLSIGPLYGSVPNDARDLDKPWHRKSWPNVHCQGRRARRCPYFDCPECDAPLGWLEDDIVEEREQLVCSGCQFELSGDALRLTRKSMGARPPDILFTSTEMLNRGMANRHLWPLLGIGDDVRAPAVILLDEVHTYGGIDGAQVALTLRRWRHLAEAKPHFVGLSATLAEAPRFMAQLVGVYPNAVATVEPRKMVTEGCEYIIALRGKPGTATLSTTIQSSMLLRRLLDADTAITQGIAGRRIFVFTDNLDVTNRLYFDLSDAEGWGIRGGRRVPRERPLASYRSSMEDGQAVRFRDGQSWDLVEKIGHDLGVEGRSIVGRTSSQDANVETNAEIVVATASLEVGFDDPLVGGVIQHQAPRDPAAYVQRKGRAGRSREMRPWTVVVLSDFGRDRLAYRSYEHLFSPDVPPRHLPIKNRHVLRIQAALSFLDWVTKYTPNSNLWADLRGPRDGSARSRQRAIEKRIKVLLSDGRQLARFAKHLKSSLGLEKSEEAMALLWEAPRSLVFSVLPTLLRRLEQQWKNSDGGEEPQTKHPLPEFVPGSLFKDLNLPEVTIRLEGHRPATQQGAPAAEPNEEEMPIRQAMGEFAPGRVSRRFGISHALDSHWVPPPEGFVGPLDIETFCPSQDAAQLGVFQFVREGAVVDVEVLRPYRLHTRSPGRGINERSDSRPHWHTQIVTDSAGSPVSLPKGSVWRDLFSNIRFYSHVAGNPIEMRRFTTGAAVSIKEANPPMQVHEGDVTYQVQRNGIATPAALGYCADIDGFAVKIRLPESTCEVVAKDPALLRSVRVARFGDLLSSAADLDGIANVFERRALADCYLALSVIMAEREGLSLDQAGERIVRGVEEALLVEVLDLLRPADAGAANLGDEPGDDSADHDADDDALRDLFRNQTVRECICEAAGVLSRKFGPDDEVWLRRSIKATIGGALLGACQRLCPQVDAGDLLVELDGGPTIEGELAPDEIWISESTIGGSGFIEAIQRAFAEDPRRFVHLFEAELEPSDFEDVDHYLGLLLNRLVKGNPDYDEELFGVFQELRQSETFAAKSSQFESMLSRLRERGIATSHAVVSSVSLRLLRPGINAETDRLTSSIIRRREEVESRHEIELDDRSFAALLASEEGVRDELRTVFPALTHLGDPVGCHALIMSLLWPRGSEVRRQSLANWNPFGENVLSDRLLLHALVPHVPATVSIKDQDWRRQLDAILLQFGRGALSAPLGESDLLATAVLDIASEPIEADSLLLYARVRAYKRMIGTAILIFDMPEALQ